MSDPLEFSQPFQELTLTTEPHTNYDMPHNYMYSGEFPTTFLITSQHHHPRHLTLNHGDIIDSTTGEVL